MNPIPHPHPTDRHFDLIIVGSGSGNAIPPELAGWRIAMVERGVFGGTCLNVGCIPSKMFVLPADRAVEAQESELNITTRFECVDWPALHNRIFGRVDAISRGGEEYRATGTEGLTLFRGTARFVADRTFDVRLNDEPDTVTISADQVLLAAGSRPVIPPIPGLGDVGYHTSDTIMRVDTLPARLGIIGGGYIAAEMGHVFSGLGSSVQLFNRSGALLRWEDQEVSERFTRRFGERVQLHLNDFPSLVRNGSDGIEIVASGGVAVVDELLVAVGRIPNADLLDPARGEVAVTADGRIETDPSMATTAPGVWAVGDLTNPFQLKHLANAETNVAFSNIHRAGSGEPERRSVDYSAVPSAVFSHPQIASVGARERDLRRSGTPYVVGRRDYAGTAYGWALDDHHSFAKVLVAHDGTILGAHVMGPQAASIIQPVVQAMAFGQRAGAVARDVLYIHPALTEVIENALLDAVDQLDARTRAP